MKKLLVAILSSACWAMPVMAADMTKIGPGDTETVIAHGICRQITNNNPVPVMIPHRTAEEWALGNNSFLAEDRPGLKLGRCLPTKAIVFECPGPYAYMGCGSANLEGVQITSNGEYVFVFENGYSGSYGIPKIHIYAMETGVPVLKRTVVLRHGRCSST